MPKIPLEESGKIAQYVDSFRESFVNGTYDVIRDGVPHQVEVRYLPGIAEVFDSLERLLKELKGESTDGFTEVSPTSIPCLKRVMLTIRRHQASRIEQGKADARNPDVLRMLDEHLKPFDDFLRHEWMQKVAPMIMPRLTDYLSVQQIVGSLQSKGRLQQRDEDDLRQRQYDDKFGILQSPNQFYDDLIFYRQICSVRGAGVIVAFIDIDDFKKINELLGAEARVDRLVLPRFMEAIEAHIFTHGRAYRYGGDEYVLLLPNMDVGSGGFFLEQLRRKLADMSYPGTTARTTVSIGFVLVDSDSFLTEWDALERANRAKTYAKTEGRKNCIVTYHGPLFDENELYVVGA
ncbi:MAG TPA: GGDEF domain-containing protein [Pyrinomonadaceae bacterium]|jgi:diguanylate cyclase (GGDEF)-like protein